MAAHKLDWHRVNMFHLDEYVNLPVTHKASFRKYLKERVLSRIPLREAHLIDGEKPQETLDALNALDTPYVNFAFTAPGKPCLLTPLLELDGDPVDDYKHVIMLMRLPQ